MAAMPAGQPATTSVWRAQWPWRADRIAGAADWSLSILRWMSPAADRPLVRALRADENVVSVELRPPRAELDTAAGIDAWIDTYHAVSGFVRAQTFVFLTDSAVGAREENNLRHLVANLGPEVPRDRVVPF